MRILLVGGGGREHALAWKIAQSDACEQLFVAPGNAGIATLAECVPIAPKDLPALVRFAREQRIDLVVVGPESPLIGGLADAMQAAGIPCFGPSRAAAQLEGSKAFAKQLMAEIGVPTAPFRVFDDPAEAKRYLHEQFPHQKCVVKADGEALGKGAFVCESLQDALDAVAFLMEQRGLGEAGQRVVIERRLYGRELSLLCFTDGHTVYPMPPVRDYKRALDGDRGPNTGGMGCFTPVPDATPTLLQQSIRQIIEPTVRALTARGTPYRGVLYAGLMIAAPDTLATEPDGSELQPFVLEFNCRFGDPEAQVLLPLLKTDFVSIAQATIEGRLDGLTVEFEPRAAVCVVLASGGYPGDYRTGIPIEGLETAAQMPNVLIFHAGTRLHEGKLVTAGGRVLNVVGLGSTLSEARQHAYRALEQIHFDGMHYRTDIAI
jgi:phosphoribosylamine--glycine ligase